MLIFLLSRLLIWAAEEICPKCLSAPSFSDTDGPRRQIDKDAKHDVDEDCFESWSWKNHRRLQDLNPFTICQK